MPERAARHEDGRNTKNDAENLPRESKITPKTTPRLPKMAPGGVPRGPKSSYNMVFATKMAPTHENEIQKLPPRPQKTPSISPSLFRRMFFPQVFRDRLQRNDTDVRNTTNDAQNRPRGSKMTLKTTPSACVCVNLVQRSAMLARARDTNDARNRPRGSKMTLKSIPSACVYVNLVPRSVLLSGDVMLTPFAGAMTISHVTCAQLRSTV